MRSAELRSELQQRPRQTTNQQVPTASFNQNCSDGEEEAIAARWQWQTSLVEPVHVEKNQKRIKSKQSLCTGVEMDFCFHFISQNSLGHLRDPRVFGG